MRQVYVEWIDSAESSGGGWESTPTAADDRVVRCKSIGFVVRETRHHLWVATTADTVNGHWLGLVRIWKEAIRECKDFEWVDE